MKLIYDVDCPKVAATRTALLQAFARAGVVASWREWNREAKDTPLHFREYGSPTILVNGEDVAGGHPTGEGDCCRLYSDGSNGFRGIPSVQQIVTALRKENLVSVPAGSPTGLPDRWQNLLAVVPAVGASLLPLGSCPLCWPAYAGLLGTIGFGFLLDKTYLLPITMALLGLALVSLAYRARARHGYWPFALGIMAVSMVLAGKLAFFCDPLVYLGLALLLGTSLWNSWPHKAVTTGSCTACAPHESVLNS